MLYDSAWGLVKYQVLTYFIAILHWIIGHPSSASIDGGFWLELVVCQMMFSRIPPKQCVFRWLWGVLVIFFLAGSIPICCGKFHFDFFVECVLFNHIFFALSLHLFLILQFFTGALGWILFAATKYQVTLQINFINCRLAYYIIYSIFQTIIAIKSCWKFLIWRMIPNSIRKNLLVSPI